MRGCVGLKHVRNALEYLSHDASSLEDVTEVQARDAALTRVLQQVRVVECEALRLDGSTHLGE
eukprot:1910841-Rhodomonas_salina.1